MADRLGAVALLGLERGLEDRQLALRALAVGGGAHAQGARLLQQAQQQRAALRFVELGVGGFDARHGQQLGDHGLVLVAALAQVQRGEVEAEHLQRAHQWRQALGDERGGMVVAQRVLDDAQIGQQLLGVAVGVLRRHGVAQRLGAGQRVQGGGGARVQAGEGAAVGLVVAVRVVVGAACHQLLHLRRDAGQAQRHAELGAQRVQLRQVKAQRHLALALECQAQGVGADVGVAVAVAADPVPHAQERRQLTAVAAAGQVLGELLVELGNLAQEGRRVVGERVLDLVGHRELGVAQHARLPQLRDAGTQQRLVACQFARRGQAVAFADQFGHRALGVEDALPLHLGGVGGQHRRDVGALQQRRHFGRSHAGFVQLVEAPGQLTALAVALALVVLAPAHMVAVLGQIGQVREVAESADHHHRLVVAQALEQLVDLLAGRKVLRAPPGHAELADAFHQFVGLATFLIADHLAQQSAEQADVFAQRLFLGGVVAGVQGGLGAARHGGGFRAWVDAEM